MQLQVLEFYAKVVQIDYVRKATMITVPSARKSCVELAVSEYDLRIRPPALSLPATCGEEAIARMGCHQ